MNRQVAKCASFLAVHFRLGVLPLRGTRLRLGGFHCRSLKLNSPHAKNTTAGLQSGKPAVSSLYRVQEATNSAQLESAQPVLICYTLSQQAGQMNVHFEWDKRKAEANLR
ncbi:MAG: hypothetical protein KJ939_08410, partial [Nanoarchaeota archaeon]|nr:hypothetical protein [Nanoarchaeota archaeon]